MVYCGKPSRGCQMCRTRRIKCDETKPTCLQCQKSRRQCPGYKDDFDLVFRNETQATERRARRSTNSKKIKLKIEHRSQARIGSTHSGSTLGNVAQKELISPSSRYVPEMPNIPIEHQAAHYFLSNFVLLPRTETSRGFLTFIIPLIKNEPPGTQLSTSFAAVALAAFANRPSSKALLPVAAQYYSKALIHINAALRDPIAAKSDQTITSVLLLGLFETVTLRRTDIGSWGTHITGAVQLIRARGRKQLRTVTGKAIFLAVRSQMLINCMSGSKSPDLGIDWWTRGAAIKNDISNDVLKLNLQTCELRADVNRAMTLLPRITENFSKVIELIRRAQELEQSFQDWEASVPDDWRFKTVAWADAIPDSDLSISEVYPGKIDIYSDLFIASQWNMARVSRLFLSGIIIRCAAWICAPVDYRTTPDYAQASRLGNDMINDIIASIPYHLGWRGFNSESTTELRTRDVSGFACGDTNLENGKTLGAFFIIWPIFTAACSDFTTDAQRKYVHARMNYMTNSMGLNGAAVLTHFQLRLPSMIVKRDLVCLFSQGNKMPAGAYITKSPPVTPITPVSATSSMNASSFSPYSASSYGSSKSPTTTSKPASISISAPVNMDSTSYPPSEVAIKEEDDEDAVLETQAESGPDWNRKRAEKIAFEKTFGPAIQETSGDNVAYLHSEPGQLLSLVESTAEEKFVDSGGNT